MKDIKTRAVVKDIKRLNKLPNLMDRVKRSSARTKQQNDNDKASSQSPVEYAQHHSALAIDKTIHTQIGMSVVVNKRWIRLIQKKKSISEDNTVARQNPVAINAKPSDAHQLRVARRLHLRKPVDGKYLLSSGQQSGKQRLIQSRVNARLVHPSHKESFPDRIRNRKGKNQERARKKEVFAAAVSHSANVRGNRLKAPTPESLRKRYVRQPSSRIPSAITKLAGHTIKHKERNFKTLSPFIKTGQRLGQANSHSDTQAGGKMNGFRAAQRTAQMTMTARRSVLRARAATRLNLRIIKMVVKAAALLIKGMAALLGISSTVIVLLCIVMAIAAVISSPFGIFVSSENMDADVKPLSQIVQGLDTEFADRLAEVQQSAGHVDRVDIQYPGSADGTRMDNWMDVIAVFAVKTAMYSENGMDVATLDAARVSLIRAIFWDMNQIDSYVETIEHTLTTTANNEDGNTSKKTTTYERILHVTITSKTAEQQALIYGFTDEQKEMMKEMLSGELRSWMDALLRGETDIGGP